MKIRIKTLALYLLICTCSTSLVKAQDRTASAIVTAEKEYKALRYANAIPVLQTVLKQNPNNTKALALMANANRKVKDYKAAEYWFSQLLQQGEGQAEWYLAYAEILANNGKYQESETWYKKYLSSANAKNESAASFAKTYPNVSSFMAQKQNWKIGFANLNTSQSDYSPAFYKEGLLFVSNRKVNSLAKNTFAWDGKPFSDLYYIEKLSNIKSVDIDSLTNTMKGDANLAKKAYRINNDDTRRTSNDSQTFSDSYVVLNDTLAKALGSLELAKRLSRTVNTKYHEGPVAVLPNNQLLFTRNNYYKGKTSKSTDGIIKLKMFFVNGNNFSDVTPFPFNNDQYSVGHPAVNAAGTVLFFTSDMPGGFGGTDLYYSTRSSLNDPWSTPVNMGKAVNTDGDEMFPTLHQDQTLFFSSTGHVGLGGLDIFQIPIDGFIPRGVPANLGAPINSSLDDFSLIRSADGLHGFFTSNRRGDDDIFTFKYEENTINVEGILVDKETKKPLPNTQIDVAYQGQKIKITTGKDGKYTVLVPKNTDVEFNYQPNGYLKESSVANVPNLPNPKVFEHDLFATKVPLSPVEKVTVECDKIKRFRAEYVFYYDLDKSNIRKDAAEIADKIAKFMKEYPQFEVYAASHTDSRASKTYNIALSHRRSSEARQYLINRGVNPKNIKVSYYGEERLVNYCTDGVTCSEAQQQLNRRTEFILKYKGKNIAELDCETLVKIHHQ